MSTLVQSTGWAYGTRCLRHWPQRAYELGWWTRIMKLYQLPKIVIEVSPGMQNFLPGELYTLDLSSLVKTPVRHLKV